MFSKNISFIEKIILCGLEENLTYKIKHILLIQVWENVNSLFLTLKFNRLFSRLYSAHVWTTYFLLTHIAFIVRNNICSYKRTSYSKTLLLGTIRYTNKI